MEKVRNIFIFSCYTGLAYIDVANSTSENVLENDGNYWIATKRQKTKVATNVLLLETPLEIIHKYQPLNKNLTFHLARHTFATTVTLSKGVPIETVSKMLGHTNIKTTQIYARITTEKIKNDMLALAKQLNETIKVS